MFMLWSTTELLGMGMTIAGSATPSSGGEHLISHWVEMKARWEGREPALDGLQVGTGTLVLLALYELWVETDPSDWHPNPDELLPPSERKQLATVGAATHLHGIGVSLDELGAAIVPAREIHRRWTILDTPYLVGLRPERLDEVLARCGWS